MMQEELFPEWGELNAQRKYPFADTAALENDEGVSLPESVFMDGRLYPLGATPRLYLSKITSTGATITVYLSDSDDTELASASYDVDSLPTVLAFTDDSGRDAGLLVPGEGGLALLASSIPVGDIEFELEQTEFTASVVVPMPSSGVRSLEVDGIRVSGDVYLVGTDGIVLMVEGGYVRVDAIGSPYAAVARCEEEGVPFTPICGVRTINNRPPDRYGDYKLTIGANSATDNILRITRLLGSLVVDTAVKGQGCNG